MRYYNILWKTEALTECSPALCVLPYHSTMGHHYWEPSLLNLVMSFQSQILLDLLKQKSYWIQWAFCLRGEQWRALPLTFQAFPWWGAWAFKMLCCCWVAQDHVPSQESSCNPLIRWLRNCDFWWALSFQFCSVNPLKQTFNQMLLFLNSFEITRFYLLEINNTSCLWKQIIQNQEKNISSAHPRVVSCQEGFLDAETLLCYSPSD